jgi:hypothetical protein
MGKRWTQEENAILREHYAEASREELLALLPGRPWESIRWRGSQVARRQRSDQIHWTDAEKEILRQHYTEPSWETLLEKLPGRSRASITSYARNVMGLHRGRQGSDKDVKAHHRAMLKKYFGADAVSAAD